MDPSSLMAYCCLHTQSAGSVRLLFTDERFADYPENTTNSVSIRLCIYLRIVMAKCDLQPGLHQISSLSLSLLLTHISSNASDRRQPDHTVRTLAMPRKLPSPYLSLYQHGKTRTPKLRASNKPEQTKPPHPKQHSSESMQ